MKRIISLICCMMLIIVWGSVPVIDASAAEALDLLDFESYPPGTDLYSPLPERFWLGGTEAGNKGSAIIEKDGTEQYLHVKTAPAATGNVELQYEAVPDGITRDFTMEYRVNFPAPQKTYALFLYLRSKTGNSSQYYPTLSFQNGVFKYYDGEWSAFSPSVTGSAADWYTITAQILYTENDYPTIKASVKNERTGVQSSAVFQNNRMKFNSGQPVRTVRLYQLNGTGKTEEAELAQMKIASLRCYTENTPQLVSRRPFNWTNVPVSGSIPFKFNEAMDPAFLNAQNIRLETVAGTPAQYSVSVLYEGAEAVGARLDYSGLAYFKNYRITLSEAIQSQSGIRVGGAYSWLMTTEPPQDEIFYRQDFDALETGVLDGRCNPELLRLTGDRTAFSVVPNGGGLAVRSNGSAPAGISTGGFLSDTPAVYRMRFQFSALPTVPVRLLTAGSVSMQVTGSKVTAGGHLLTGSLQAGRWYEAGIAAALDGSVVYLRDEESDELYRAEAEGTAEPVREVSLMYGTVEMLLDDFGIIRPTAELIPADGSAPALVSLDCKELFVRFDTPVKTESYQNIRLRRGDQVLEAPVSAGTENQAVMSLPALIPGETYTVDVSGCDGADGTPLYCALKEALTMTAALPAMRVSGMQFLRNDGQPVFLSGDLKAEDSIAFHAVCDHNGDEEISASLYVCKYEKEQMIWASRTPVVLQSGRNLLTSEAFRPEEISADTVFKAFLFTDGLVPLMNPQIISGSADTNIGIDKSGWPEVKSEDFDGREEGAFDLPPFKAEGAGAKLQVVSENGGKYLRFTGDGGSCFYDAPIGAPTVIEADFRPADVAGGHLLNLMTSAKHLSHLVLLKDGQIYLKDAEDTEALSAQNGRAAGTYTKDRWINIRAVVYPGADPSAPGRYDLYINHIPAGKNLKLPPVSGAERIRLAGFGCAAVDMDNVFVYPLCKEAEEMFAQLCANQVQMQAAETSYLTQGAVDAYFTEEKARRAMTESIRKKQAELTIEEYEESGADFYVAPDGSDQNDGSFAQPFATLACARDAVRELKKTVSDRDIVVMLRGGIYRIEDELVFDERDSGTEGHRVIYTGYPGEEAVVTSGKEIKNWEQWSTDVYRAYIPEVKAGAWRFDQIFEDDVRAVKARFPNEGFLMAEGGEAGRKLRFSEGAIPEWKDISGAQLFVFPTFPWQNDVVSISAIDHQNRLISINGETHAGRNGFRQKDYYFIQGILEELDMPGEFYLDESAGYLYYWPKGDIHAVTVTAPVTENIFRFEGSAWNKKAERITLTGLTLTETRFTKNYTIMDASDAKGSRLYPAAASKHGLVYTQNAREIEIKGCRLKNSGFMGVMFDYYSQDCVVFGNEITDTGYAGVYLAGNQNMRTVPETAETGCDNARNIISNNCLSRTGRLAWHGAGIMAYHSRDNDISYNVISDIYRQGVFLMQPETIQGDHVTRTENNTVRFNKLTNVSNETHDSGALNNWDAAYTTFDSNRIDGVGYEDSFVMGIYLDNDSSRVTVKNNIVTGMQGYMPWSIFFRGTEHSIYNNILTAKDGDMPCVFRNAPQGGQCVNVGHMISRNILASGAGNSAMMEFADFNAESFQWMDYNAFWDENGAYQVNGLPGIRNLTGWKHSGRCFDTHSETGDMQFADQGGGDYRPGADSITYDVGFRQIREDKIGTLPSYPFAPPDELEHIYAEADGKTSVVQMEPGETLPLHITGRTHQGFFVSLDETKIAVTGGTGIVSAENGSLHCIGEGEAELEITYQDGGKVCRTTMDVLSGVQQRRSDNAAVNLTARRGERILLTPAVELAGELGSGADPVVLSCESPDILVFDDLSIAGRCDGVYQVEAVSGETKRSITVTISE